MIFRPPNCGRGYFFRDAVLQNDHPCHVLGSWRRPGGSGGPLGVLGRALGMLWVPLARLWGVWGRPRGLLKRQTRLYFFKTMFSNNHYMKTYVHLFHSISFFICRLDYLWHICLFISKPSLYVHTLVCNLGRPHSTNV